MSSSDDSTKSYPLTDIVYPGVHDVLCGRGGHAISHPGNVKFRMLVEQYKAQYVQASRYEKSQVTSNVVRMWRAQSPPGRFLCMTDPLKGDASRWHDIGDKGAIKKVAQCLRERNPRADYMNAVSAAASLNIGGSNNDTAMTTDPVGSTISVTTTAPPTSAVGAGPLAVAASPAPVLSFAPTGQAMGNWKQKKQQQQEQRRNPDHHQPKVPSAFSRKQDLKSPIQQSRRFQSHSKSRQRQREHQQAQRQQKQQDALEKEQAMLVQKQVEKAEQDVWEAQQQVDQQAKHLQEALKQRFQQEAAAVQQASLTQQVQQQALNQQVAAAAFTQQVAQGLMRGQAMVQPQTMSDSQAMDTGQTMGQPQPFLAAQQPQEESFYPEQEQQQDDGISDTVSILSSPFMWDTSPQSNDGNYDQEEKCSNNPKQKRGSIPTRDSVANSMPSAANLTKLAFNDEPTNGSSGSGSSDSSTATSDTTRKMNKILYSHQDAFSDTSSENNFSVNGFDYAISEGGNSIAPSSAYAPD